MSVKINHHTSLECAWCIAEAKGHATSFKRRLAVGTANTFMKSGFPPRQLKSLAMMTGAELELEMSLDEKVKLIQFYFSIQHHRETLRSGSACNHIATMLCFVSDELWYFPLRMMAEQFRPGLLSKKLQPPAAEFKEYLIINI
ncbi:hypothetical protein Tco_0128188 [Tanacetum coccineum]